MNDINKLKKELDQLEETMSWQGCGSVSAFVGTIIRISLIIGTQFLMIAIINTTDLSDNGAIALVSNFTAVFIICEMDDQLFQLGIVQ
jgi:hypothetical protein